MKRTARSSLRMRTLRGGARYYVEKLNRRAKDRIRILSQQQLFLCDAKINFVKRIPNPPAGSRDALPQHAPTLVL